jgi:hypothetical protein
VSEHGRRSVDSDSFCGQSGQWDEQTANATAEVKRVTGGDGATEMRQAKVHDVAHVGFAGLPEVSLGGRRKSCASVTIVGQYGPVRLCSSEIVPVLVGGAPQLHGSVTG